MKEKSGSVIVLAVWTLFMLAAFALAVGAYVSSNLTLAGTLKRDTVAFYAAKAGVEYVREAQQSWGGGTAEVTQVSGNVSDVGEYEVKVAAVVPPVTNFFGYAFTTTSSNIISTKNGRWWGTSAGWPKASTNTPVRIDFVIDNGGNTLYWYRH